jgi:hypothetical protein
MLFEMCFFCSIAAESCFLPAEFGSDMNIQLPTKTPSAIICQTVCQNIAGCQFFSYKISTQDCWLKFGQGTAQASTDFVSGPYRCTEPQGLPPHTNSKNRDFGTSEYNQKIIDGQRSIKKK